MSEISNESAGPRLSAEQLYRELHDGLCQNITASLFFAQNLRSRLRKDERSDEVLLTLADSAVNAATSAVADMRVLLEKLGNDRKDPGETSVAKTLARGGETTP
jgi:signal transduction histidine kinase